MNLVDTNKMSEVIEIADHASFAVATTRIKPKHYPNDMKSLIITKWNNQQFYRATIGAHEGKEIWIHKSAILDKETIKNFHSMKHRKRYNNKLPATFKDANVGWGDPFQPKNPDTIRISMENVRSIGVKCEKNLKQDKLIEWLVRNEIDIACWQEVGVNWSRCRRKHKLTARLNCSAWEKSKVIAAHNKHDSYSKGQYGGTAVAAFGHVTGTIDDTAVDPTGLGRWASLKLQGKGGVKTRIISAYNPCKPGGHKFKPNAVYNQHKRYFLKHGIVTCPREKFKCDLIEAIRTCNKNGEQIILCIDMNEDFTRHNGPLYTALTEEVSLHNVLTTKHPHLPPPATQDTGTRPIDAIMVSKTLLGIDYGGWLQFGACIGDHRPAYIDINLKTLIDKKKYDIVTAKARRLQIGNAKALEKYLRYVEREFRKERLLPRVEELTKKITSGAKIN